MTQPEGIFAFKTRAFLDVFTAIFGVVTKQTASGIFLGGYQGHLLLFHGRNCPKSWRNCHVVLLSFSREILHVIGDSRRSVSQGLRFRKTLLVSHLLYILTWKCSWTFVLRWDSNVAAIWRFWIHCGHLGRVWLSLMPLMAYQTMERFTRLEIQTFFYCVGANGPRLFKFSGESLQKVRTPSAVVFLLITSFL